MNANEDTRLAAENESTIVSNDNTSYIEDDATVLESDENAAPKTSSRKKVAQRVAFGAAGFVAGTGGAFAVNEIASSQNTTGESTLAAAATPDDEMTPEELADSLATRVDPSVNPVTDENRAQPTEIIVEEAQPETRIITPNPIGNTPSRSSDNVAVPDSTSLGTPQAQQEIVPEVAEPHVSAESHVEVDSPATDSATAVAVEPVAAVSDSAPASLHISVESIGTIALQNGNVVNHASLEIEDVRATFIDADNDGTVDAAIIDSNNDGTIDQNDVVVDMSDTELTMDDIVAQMGQNDNVGDDLAMNDFANDVNLDY